MENFHPKSLLFLAQPRSIINIRCQGNTASNFEIAQNEVVTSSVEHESFPQINWTLTELIDSRLDVPQDFKETEETRESGTLEEVEAEDEDSVDEEEANVFEVDLRQEITQKTDERNEDYQEHDSDIPLSPTPLNPFHAQQFFDNGVTDDVIDTMNFTSNFQPYQLPVDADVSDVTTFLDRLLMGDGEEGVSRETFDTGSYQPPPPFQPEDYFPLSFENEIDDSHISYFNNRPPPRDSNSVYQYSNADFVDQSSADDNASPEEEFLRTLERQNSDESDARNTFSSDKPISHVIATSRNRNEMTSSRARVAPALGESRFPSTYRQQLHRTRVRQRYRLHNNDDVINTNIGEDTRRIDDNRDRFEDYDRRRRPPAARTCCCDASSPEAAATSQAAGPSMTSSSLFVPSSG